MQWIECSAAETVPQRNCSGEKGNLCIPVQNHTHTHALKKLKKKKKIPARYFAVSHWNVFCWRIRQRWWGESRTSHSGDCFLNTVWSWIGYSCILWKTEVNYKWTVRQFRSTGQLSPLFLELLCQCFLFWMCECMPQNQSGSGSLCLWNSDYPKEEKHLSVVCCMV